MTGLGGGHYTAHCKHPVTQKWSLYNDSRVSEIAESSIGGSESYVLFYQRTA